MKKQSALNKVLQRKVDEFVERSEISNKKLVTQLTNRQIDDVVIPKRLIKFSGNGGIHVHVPEGEQNHDWTLTSNSAYQVADRLGLPQGWISKAPGGDDFHRDAASYALNRYMENYEGKDDRFLFRNVNGVVRGFLSTSYKRLNTREIFLMFLMLAEKQSLPVVGAFEGSSRDYLEVIDPRIIYVETPNNDVVAYARGAQLRNSDFGDGKLELKAYNLQAVCLNGATGRSFLKEVHLGARMAQDFIFSIETVNKDTETRALMIRDAMDWIFSEKGRQFDEAQVIEASGQVVELPAEIERLPQIGVTKTEAKVIEGLLMKRDPEDGLIGKPSKWMFAQAISAYARETNEERKRELQQVAGNMIFTKDPEILDFKEN